MNHEKYDYFADSDFANFTFDSVGPKGIIKKAVNFRSVPSEFMPDGTPVVNLGFGDWDEEHKWIDDTSVSNNKDRDKILSTVASTILSYTEKNELLPVYFKGSSPAKTRLYQMGINAHWQEIEKLFMVYGLLQNKWTIFKKGINYEAFLGIRKFN